MAILRWGIIGCGNVAEHKGGPPLYTVDGSELIAVMRRDREKAVAFAEKHGAKRVYTDVDKLLADDEINAVYIATHPYLHCEQTIRAAQAGKHILCEKPMAMTVEECQRMVDVCDKAGVILMLAYYRNHYPNIVKMKALMDEGVIGEVVLARINCTGFYNPNRPDLKNWRINPEMSGGGVLMDIGSHRISLLEYLMGDIESVRGFAETVHQDIPVDDSAVFTLRFENGSHAVANINWNVGIGIDNVEVYGTTGSLTCSPLNSGNLTLMTKSDGQVEMNQTPLPYTHTGLVEDFVNHIKTGEPIRCSGESGLQTNAIISQIYTDNS
ncbi:MAG: Gfo/Idh/MocA family oxidoreductase [Candidatus Poribacteria bacterium]|nr:Gfo/Idh/MocA family oxidoreductase [Candidatus Poribacteria bacterium]